MGMPRRANLDSENSRDAIARLYRFVPGLGGMVFCICVSEEFRKSLANQQKGTVGHFVSNGWLRTFVARAVLGTDAGLEIPGRVSAIGRRGNTSLDRSRCTRASMAN